MGVGISRALATRRARRLTAIGSVVTVLGLVAGAVVTGGLSLSSFTFNVPGDAPQVVLECVATSPPSSASPGGIVPLDDSLLPGERVGRGLLLKAGSLGVGIPVNVEWTPPPGASDFAFSVAPLNPAGPPPFLFQDVAVQEAGATVPAMTVGYTVPDAPTGESNFFVVDTFDASIVDQITAEVDRYAASLRSAVGETAVLSAMAARPFGGSAAGLAGATSTARSPRPGLRAPSGLQGRDRSAQALLQDYWWWAMQLWWTVQGKELDAQGCQSLTDFLQSGKVFAAVRYPVMDAGWDGSSSYRVPLVRRSSFTGSPVLQLLDHDSGSAVWELPLELTPSRMGFAETYLPGAPGERWMTLAPAQEPLAFCPEDLFIWDGSWEVDAWVPIDLGGEENACPDCVISSYFCYEGGEEPYFFQDSAELLGASVMATSFRGHETTCIGPIPTRLTPPEELRDPPFGLENPSSAVAQPEEQVSLKNVLSNYGSQAVTVNLSLESSLGLPWTLYFGFWDEPNLSSPVTGPVWMGAYDTREIWAVVNVPAGASGLDTVQITATNVADAQQSAWVTDILWVGDWAPPPVPAAIALEQHEVTLGQPVKASGALPDGSYRLVIAPAGTYSVGECYGETPVASVDVQVTGNTLPSTTVWPSAVLGEYDLLALSGQCVAASSSLTAHALATTDRTVVAGDDLGEGIGLVVTPPASDYDAFIAAAADTAGVPPTRWQTDVDLLNPGAEDAQVDLALLLANQGNPSPETVRVNVPAGQTLRLPNVLGSTFDASNAALGVKVVTGEVSVNSRFYNTASECGGTYGMFIPAVAEEGTITSAQPGYFHHLSYSTDPDKGFRTNIGFVNVLPLATQVEITLYGDSGQLIGTKTQMLQPYEHRQFTRVHAFVFSGAVEHGWARVRVLTQGGAVIPYAMLIDNLSGDPIFMFRVTGEGTVLAGMYDLAVAAAANTAGVPPTRWQTDLDLFNPGTQAARVRLAVLKANRANPTPVTTEVDVPAGLAVRMPNLLGSTFVYSNAGIGIEMVSGWVDANTRFYNTASECGGTYGMYIPATSGLTAVVSGQLAYFHHLSYSQTLAAGFRTNIGFLNNSGVSAEVEIKLYGDAGDLLGTLPYTLQPWEHRQFTRIHAALGTGEVTHGWATVEVKTPSARVHTYAMLIDNLSGDPIFMTPWVVAPPSGD